MPILPTIVLASGKAKTLLVLNAMMRHLIIAEKLMIFDQKVFDKMKPMEKRKGPWTVIGTKVVYQNPWIKVREDEVVRPDGKRGVFGVVSMIPGVSVLPLDDKGSVYLTKEYHYGVKRVTIEVVSGGINKTETRLQAAKRELKEETGLIAKKWTYLGVVDPFTTAIVSPNQMYLAQKLTQFEDEQEGTEK